MRSLARQSRGHVDLIRVGSEMYQGPLLEVEQRGAWVTIHLILPHGMAPVLAGAWVLQLARRDGQSIHGNHEVNRAMIVGMARHLAGNSEPILGIQLLDFFIEPMRRLEVRHLERLAIEFESMPQDVKRALNL